MIHGFGGFELDADKFELRCNGARVAVEPQVLSLLLLLVINRDRLVSRDEIIDVVWNGRIVSEAALSSRIKSARHALGDDGHAQRMIRTIHGKGFRFVGLEAALAPAEPAERSPTHRGESEPATAQANRPSIAVLPFRLLGAPDRHSVMAEALPHDLIAELSRLHWLFVIARGSSFRFRSSTVDVRRVGQKLGVRYCLTGSVESAAERVCFTVELADTRDGGIVWAERYAVRAEDVHEVRARIVGSIIAALEIQIPAHEARMCRVHAPDRIDAWSAYHLGLQHMFRFNKRDNEVALGLFKQAVDIAPEFARAYGGLSFGHFQNAFLNYGPDVHAESASARRYAEQAVSIDPLDPFAMLNMGRAHWLTGEIDTSLGWLDRSIALNPNYAQAIYARAWSKMILCDGADAQRNADAAMSLSPIDPMHYAMMATRALSHLTRSEYEEAAAWAQKAARAPGAHHLIAVIAVACHQLNGNSIDAATWACRARNLNRNTSQAIFFRSFPFNQPEVRDRIAMALKTHGI